MDVFAARPFVAPLKPMPLKPSTAFSSSVGRSLLCHLESRFTFTRRASTTYVPLQEEEEEVQMEKEKEEATAANTAAAVIDWGNDLARPVATLPTSSSYFVALPSWEKERERARMHGWIGTKEREGRELAIDAWTRPPFSPVNA